MARKPKNNVVQIADMRGKHQVLVLADHSLEYPELYLNVFIAGDAFEQRAFAEMFGRALCKRVDAIEDADIVVFTGGVDVDPQLYGEKPHSETRWNEDRDNEDIGLYLQCLEMGIPMLGICRGAQFLHVMNGGSLYQHINNHYGDHRMWDMLAKEMVERVSSVHHQSVIPTKDPDFSVVAIAIDANCDSRWKSPTVEVLGTMQDVEAFFYRSTCCFGIQGHPEYRGYNYFAIWALRKINEFFITNPDMTWIDKRRRLKPELIAERNHIAEQKIKTPSQRLLPS